jgi:hypothetical protein
MNLHPVHFDVVPPERFARVQLLVRLVAALALGMLGLSLGAVFLAAYLGLAVWAAVRVASLGGAARYLGEDGPRVLRALRWLGVVFAWMGLTAERLPARAPEEVVTLTIDAAAPRPTPGAAILRVFTGLPSLIVLALLGMVGGLVWLWAAVTILVEERVGAGAFRFLVGLERWALRLLAYQACLVDEYPPFSFADEPPAHPVAT